MEVDDPAQIPVARDRWFRLYHSGRFNFRCETLPTEVILEDDGSQTFYFLDVDGLEFEMRSGNSE